jgi:hypothetical protein
MKYIAMLWYTGANLDHNLLGYVFPRVRVLVFITSTPLSLGSILSYPDGSNLGNGGRFKCQTKYLRKSENLRIRINDGFREAPLLCN